MILGIDFFRASLCLVRFSFFTGFFLCASPAFSSLVINPVILEFSPKVTVQEITLENKADDTKAFEISLKKWQQDKNEDVYTETPDLIVFPLAVKLPPKSKQKFRLILKNPPQGAEQASYRLFFVESSYQTRSKPDVSAVTFLLKMTVPVFVSGANYKPEEKVIWSADIPSKDMVLSLKNDGNRFIKIRNVTLKEVPSFGSPDWQYVLPKTTKTWTVPLGKKVPTDSITVHYAAIESFEEKKKNAKVSLSTLKVANKTQNQKVPSVTVATTKP